MSPPTLPLHALKPVRRAGRIAYVPLIAAGLLLLGVVMTWLVPELRLSAINGALGDASLFVGPDRASLPGALIPLVLLTIPSLIFAWTMWLLYRLFRRMAQGILLDQPNASLVSRAGLGFVLVGAIGTLSNTLIVLAITAANPPGERVFSVGFSTASLGALAAGFAFWGLGAVLSEAARVAEDSASIL
ncbi:MAG: hypothetical protein KI785_14310 [Devosiaceae bacterium]|nr:hypothetical protein [Devosiaceae bacterium MH13]